MTHVGRQLLKTSALALALSLAWPAALQAGTCKQSYHVETNFLANPDESILIAAAIGWCRNHKHRLIWDERYAAVARKWSGFLVEAGGPSNRSLSQDRLRFELRQAGVTDAAVLPYSAVSQSEKVPDGLLRFLDEQVERGRYTHFAVGVTRQADQKRMVTTLLLGRRPVLIRPLPVCPDPGIRQEISVQLLRGYSHPRWLMTTPRGDVTQGSLLYEEGHWKGKVPLDAGRGEYTFELIANGPTGPEVAALFPLFAGVERPLLPRTKAHPAPERYRTPAAAEQALLALINKARQALELPSLPMDAKLSSIAREHAMQLLFERHATHRTARTGALTDRLRKAGTHFERALENVSLSPSPEAAHERFMSSPGHRINVLDPSVTKLGIGVAMERTSTEDVLAVCQVFIEPPEGGPEAATVKAVIEAINHRRQKKGRFALGLDKDLSKFARQSARRMVASGSKADPQAEGESLLATLEDGPITLADVAIRYVKTRDPARVLASPEIYEESFNRLGVGIARSVDASRAGEMWIALIFAGR
jgi:uncharacterized protein YkwD